MGRSAHTWGPWGPEAPTSGSAEGQRPSHRQAGAAGRSACRWVQGLPVPQKPPGRGAERPLMGRSAEDGAQPLLALGCAEGRSPSQGLRQRPAVKKVENTKGRNRMVPPFCREWAGKPGSVMMTIYLDRRSPGGSSHIDRWLSPQKARRAAALLLRSRCCFG